jgi:hypothetical protein
MRQITLISITLFFLAAGLAFTLTLIDRIESGDRPQALLTHVDTTREAAIVIGLMAFICFVTFFLLVFALKSHKQYWHYEIWRVGGTRPIAASKWRKDFPGHKSKKIATKVAINVLQEGNLDPVIHMIKVNSA